MRPRRLKNEINVVPYIDVMLVLLVIFMVTAPMMTPASVDLPTVGSANQVPSQPIEVIIHADEKITLRNRQIPNASEQPVASGRLVQAVQEAQGSNEDQPVVIAGDKSIQYAAVLKVMDELKKANVKRVGLLVQANPGAVK